MNVLLSSFIHLQYNYWVSNLKLRQMELPKGINPDMSFEERMGRIENRRMRLRKRSGKVLDNISQFFVILIPILLSITKIERIKETNARCKKRRWTFDSFYVQAIYRFRIWMSKLSPGLRTILTVQFETFLFVLET